MVYLLSAPGCPQEVSSSDEICSAASNVQTKSADGKMSPLQTSVASERRFPSRFHVRALDEASDRPCIQADRVMYLLEPSFHLSNALA